MIEIDGSYGEGGGQILRTAVTEGKSAISVPAVTDHFKINLWVINRFLSLETQIQKEKNQDDCHPTIGVNHPAMASM